MSPGDSSTLSGKVGSVLLQVLGGTAPRTIFLRFAMSEKSSLLEFERLHNPLLLELSKFPDLVDALIGGSVLFLPLSESLKGVFVTRELAKSHIGSNDPASSEPDTDYSTLTGCSVHVNLAENSISVESALSKAHKNFICLRKETIKTSIIPSDQPIPVFVISEPIQFDNLDPVKGGRMPLFSKHLTPSDDFAAARASLSASTWSVVEPDSSFLINQAYHNIANLVGLPDEQVHVLRAQVHGFSRTLLGLPHNPVQLAQHVKTFFTSTLSHLAIGKPELLAESTALSDSLERCLFLLPRVYDALVAIDEKLDLALSRRCVELRFIRPEHLDLHIPAHGDPAHEQWEQAKTLLRDQLNRQKVPFEKLQCIASCSRLILELCSSTRMGKAVSADDFLPMLIYCIMRSNPPNLRSNIAFINTYISEGHLQSEAAYQLCSLLSAVTFIEKAQAENFTIDPDVYQRQLAHTRQMMGCPQPGRPDGEEEGFTVDDDNNDDQSASPPPRDADDGASHGDGRGSSAAGGEMSAEAIGDGVDGLAAGRGVSAPAESTTAMEPTSPVLIVSSSREALVPLVPLPPHEDPLAQPPPTIRRAHRRANTTVSANPAPSTAVLSPRDASPARSPAAALVASGRERDEASQAAVSPGARSNASPQRRVSPTRPPPFLASTGTAVHPAPSSAMPRAGVVLTPRFIAPAGNVPPLVAAAAAAGGKTPVMGKSISVAQFPAPRSAASTPHPALLVGSAPQPAAFRLAAADEFDPLAESHQPPSMLSPPQPQTPFFHARGGAAQSPPHDPVSACPRHPPPRPSPIPGFRVSLPPDSPKSQAPLGGFAADEEPDRPQPHLAIPTTATVVTTATATTITTAAATTTTTTTTTAAAAAAVPANELVNGSCVEQAAGGGGVEAELARWREFYGRAVRVFGQIMANQQQQQPPL
ncbi:putative Vacuolar sorting protein 9 [Paratrimastix pyriformis]|uniref:Vacuolar sorting protein 9 n=1 Tax=Paratrimastix pyriformis TaxID=342808 RepID=A0ABQ8UAE9_9EUKA|nr:putative Vacuolar sorting protein 9 [Paratrimastix pyriformis]